MRARLILSSVLLALHAHAYAAGPAGASATDLVSWCQEVTRVIPQVRLNSCVSAELKPWAKSVNGRDILLHDHTPPQQPVARVLVVGGIHGDELTSVSIVFRWIERLKNMPGEAARYQWRVIPLLNPDGLLAKPPTRVNARGVDLNRNFPTDNWSREATHYWSVSTRRDPRRFPGRAARSEPESSWLHNEIETFRPDVIISVHAPYNVLDFDGPPKGIPPPLRFGPLKLHQLGVYPGSLGNFGGLKAGIPVVTLELPHALEMPGDKELAQVWHDMQGWLKRNLVDRKAEAAP